MSRPINFFEIASWIAAQTAIDSSFSARFTAHGIRVEVRDFATASAEYELRALRASIINPVREDLPRLRAQAGHNYRDHEIAPCPVREG